MSLIVSGSRADVVHELLSTALELLVYALAIRDIGIGQKATHGVAGFDTSVYDIGTGSGTSGVIIAVAGRAGTGVGETGKAPRSAGLSDDGGDAGHGVLFDILDLSILSAIADSLWDQNHCRALTLGSLRRVSISSSVRLAAKPLMLSYV